MAHISTRFVARIYAQIAALVYWQETRLGEWATGQGSNVYIGSYISKAQHAAAYAAEYNRIDAEYQAGKKALHKAAACGLSFLRRHIRRRWFTDCHEKHIRAFQREVSTILVRQRRAQADR